MSVVKVAYKGDWKFEAVAGNHTLTIDVPPSMGGKDRGMTPTELFACSLAGCIGVLVTQYCHDMKINPDGLSVEMTYDKLENPTRLGNFKVAIHIPKGDFEARKEGVIRAADRCPVHETIRRHESIQISVSK